jgi:hypothetical protein
VTYIVVVSTTISRVIITVINTQITSILSQRALLCDIIGYPVAKQNNEPSEAMDKSWNLPLAEGIMSLTDTFPSCFVNSSTSLRFSPILFNHKIENKDESVGRTSHTTAIHHNILWWWERDRVRSSFESVCGRFIRCFQEERGGGGHLAC